MKIRLMVLVLGAFVGAGLSVPSLASADAIGELQARIKALMEQVASLTKQLQELQGTVSGGTAEARHRVCDALSRPLSLGARGEDVSKLQEFLRDQGYLDSEPTGYFGALTRTAIGEWQTAEGIAAGGSLGIVGPLTRERVKSWCAKPNARLSASPRAGNAPLTVEFSTWLSGFRAPDPSHVIDFGDGSREAATSCNAPLDGCVAPGVNRHTYASNGTYKARLIEVRANPAGETVLATAKIKVGQTGACTKEYRPVCGAKPVVCITAPCNPVPTTYGNECEMAASGASYLYSGVCRTETADPGSDPMCKSWYDGCNTCSRQEPGAPGMCTLRACIGGTEQKAYCTAYFSSGDNKAPVISSFSGPTTLAVNEVGEWRIDASDPEDGPLSYSIFWGDEVLKYQDALMASAGAEASFTQSSAFTHRYASAGTYKVRVAVRDRYGLTAEASATVRVGASVSCRGFNEKGDAYKEYSEGEKANCIPEGAGKACIADAAFVCRGGVWKREGGLPTACTMEYAPVCGMVTEYNTCQPTATTMCAAWASKTYEKTFSNKCMLNAAGATFLYTGECRNVCANAGQTYVEGDRLNCLTSADGVGGSCVSDAYYVCRGGTWKVEGTLPAY